MDAKRLSIDNPSQLSQLHAELVESKKNYFDRGFFFRITLWQLVIGLLLFILERIFDALIGATALSANVFKELRHWAILLALGAYGVYRYWMSRKHKTKKKAGDELSFEVIEGIYTGSETVRVGLEFRHRISLSDVVQFKLGASHSISDFQKVPSLSINCVMEEGAIDRVFPSKGSTIVVSRQGDAADGVIQKTTHYVLTMG